jgi:hypothetical protein
MIYLVYYNTEASDELTPLFVQILTQYYIAILLVFQLYNIFRKNLLACLTCLTCLFFFSC